MKSPFKFLDAYDRPDNDIFFGRAEEIDQLYTLVFQTTLLLVYGQSGTGKTSLIQCGLANRFKPTDWYEVFVRRRDNINASLHREIRRNADTLIPENLGVPAAIQSLYLDHLRPVYLIFDQFEELFILGSKEEQQNFIRTIAALVKSDVACKIIFVMREEYIATLYDFERAIPSLFHKRFRVEPMSLQNVQGVITGTAAAFGIGLEQGDTTAHQIIESLSEHGAGVQLSYLQVYLDTLYREAMRGRSDLAGGETPVIFTEKLVRRTGALGDVMVDFLDEQTAAVQGKLSSEDRDVPSNTVQLLLEEFATLEGTKQSVSRGELSVKLHLPDSIVGECLFALENSRILRNVDGMYELSHDSLAGRIADKRSIERKNLLKVQKLVKDRFSVFEQTRTYLNREELAYSQPYRTHLDLSAQEARFLEKSESVARRQERKRIVLIFSWIMLVLVLLVIAFGVKTYDYHEAYVGILLKEQAADSARQDAEKRLRELNYYIAQDIAALPERDSTVKTIVLQRLEHYMPEPPDVKGPVLLSEQNRNHIDNSEAIVIEGNRYDGDLLKHLMPEASEINIRKFISAFNRSDFAKAISTPRRFAAYLAVVSVISKDFNYLEVSYNYSSEELKEKFGSMFRNPRSLEHYAGNPEAVANRINASQYGNGDESSGDGWKYRGRGIFKVWSKDRYREYAIASGIDLLNHPELLSDVEVATTISGIVWANFLGGDRFINTLADKEDFAAIADRIASQLDTNAIKNPKETLMESYRRYCPALEVR
jgi:predicted chitinase